MARNTTNVRRTAIAATGDTVNPVNEGNVVDLANRGKGTATNDSPKHGKQGGLFSGRAVAITAQAARKAELFGSATQRLAEASDLFREGEGKAKEAREVANDAAVKLYTARIEKLATPEEISSALGQQFGFKVQAKTGKASKTPDGQGEAIRKRIVRATLANEYVNGGDGGTFFTGRNVDDVRHIVERLNDGSKSIWTAYEDFAAIEVDGNGPTPAAFDVKKLAKMVEDLASPDARDKIAASEDLQAAYAALLSILNLLNDTGTDDGEAVAA